MLQARQRKGLMQVEMEILTDLLVPQAEALQKLYQSAKLYEVAAFFSLRSVISNLKLWPSSHVDGGHCHLI
jgi:hypothetical protein